jgi:hypothetical protein
LDENVAELAFHGKWSELLTFLRRHPDLANTESKSKGYTPLHQAAWHGADLSVVGELLSIGADRALKTYYRGQTAQEIAKEKHADRLDLEYVLAPRRLNLSQMMRKVVADIPDLFSAYDGNQVVCDRLIECFCSAFINSTSEDAEGRLDSAFMAITGVPLSSSRAITFEPSEHFLFEVDANFWKGRFLSAIQTNMSRAHLIPIQEAWAVISDLFDPAPSQWGLRGDLFLWMEMRQAFCHIEIPRQPEDLGRLISAAFAMFTGASLEKGATVHVKHLARGGMSSGMVSGEFWCEKFIPLIVQRSKWLRETWQRK